MDQEIVEWAGTEPVFRGDGATLDAEAAYATGHSKLPARVFLIVGGLEQDDPFSVISRHFVDHVKALPERVAAHDYRGLEMTTKVFPEETHLSVAPAAYSRGLRVVFG